VDRRIIADTSGIIAFLDRDDHYHSSVVDIIKTHQIYIPVTVLPEVDYLATKYLGERVARSFLEDLADGYFNYLPTELNDINKATKIMERYYEAKRQNPNADTRDLERKIDEIVYQLYGLTGEEIGIIEESVKRK
jgi:predicted nucleic acid-binding protein